MKKRNGSQWPRRTFVGWTLALGLGLGLEDANAAQTLRMQVDQKGDFLLIGNTLGHECAANTPAPIVGTVGMCGANLNDSAPDIFWRSESPANGQAEANTTLTVAQARSTAVLSVPAGATVTHAFLYWGATVAGGDTTATLDRPGVFSQDLNAMQMYTSSNNSYQSVADITAIVQAQGSGAYRVSGVNSVNIVNLNDNNSFAGWWMVVFYQLNSDPPRNLALFDGLDNVDQSNPQNITLSGFFVPPVFTAAKLGIVTFEGDNLITGDSFSFGPAPALADGNNPANNFFNSTRTFLGMPVTTAGDLPQLAGTPQSMSGVDIDVVDVTNKLMAGQTSIPISATSAGDTYYLAGFVTSIPTFKPDFSTSQKTAVDLNGGSLLPGDIVEYTIVATNTGNDTSIGTIMTDPLPMGVTYVPGTIQITAGANMGGKTDIALDDQCEYDGGTRTITCRLGTMANATNGGQLLVGESTTLVFRVQIDSTSSGTILNQATITASGLLGAPAEGTPTDGNGVADGGQPPTPILVEECTMDAQCNAPTPYCYLTKSPNLCVECFMNAHCPAMKPSCLPATNTCACIPSGMDVCDGVDNDCDGVIDNDCPNSDTDGDGLTNGQEIALDTDPNDADSDDDGALDGQEANPTEDTDGDGKINVLDSDSDNDGLFDGTEMGFDCSNPNTDISKNVCIPDADMGATTTAPIDSDTDNGGVTDGSEDVNRNGRVDPGEGDPLDPSDDPGFVDTDGDGLTDSEEKTLDTEPNDADTDDDGVLDGQEANPAEDTDGDGLINVLDPDSDDDGLFDGTEMGLDCFNPATDSSQMQCIPDADMGTTKTSPLDADTDQGGIPDGTEDANGNGQVDTGETNPLDPTDDKIIATCGNGLMDPGEICDDGNSLSNDGCDDNCTPTSCGNGKLTTGEACDDGNTRNDDGCSASCAIETPETGDPGPDEPAGCACSTPSRAPTDLPVGSAVLLGLCVARRIVKERKPRSWRQACKTHDTNTKFR